MFLGNIYVLRWWLCSWTPNACPGIQYKFTYEKHLSNGSSKLRSIYCDPVYALNKRWTNTKYKSWWICMWNNKHLCKNRTPQLPGIFKQVNGTWHGCACGIKTYFGSLSGGVSTPCRYFWGSWEALDEVRSHRVLLAHTIPAGQAMLLAASLFIKASSTIGACTFTHSHDMKIKLIDAHTLVLACGEISFHEPRCGHCSCDHTVERNMVHTYYKTTPPH